jgi:hypothetical protein
VIDFEPKGLSIEFHRGIDIVDDLPDSGNMSDHCELLSISTRRMLG